MIHSPARDDLVVLPTERLATLAVPLLTYQVDFEYRDDALIECMRAYPFAYQLKLQDGNIVGVQSRMLLVAPRGMEPGRGAWCPATDGCF